MLPKKDQVRIRLQHQYYINYIIPGLRDYSLLAKDIYNLFINRMQLSIAYGTVGYYGPSYYNKYDNYYYIVFSLNELEQMYHVSEPTIRKAMKELQSGGYINLHYKKVQHYTQIEMPKLMNNINNNPKCIQRPYAKQNHNNSQNKKNDSKRGRRKNLGVPPKEFFARVSNENEATKKTTNDTVNTENSAESKSKHFRKIDPLTSWVNSASSKRGGLTLGASQCIARFCSKHYKNNPVNHCREIYKILVEARGSVLKGCHKHLSKKVVRFESNGNIINGLESKLRKIFTRVINRNSKKLNVNHFYGYLMASLKNFFHSAFGLDKRVIVTPQSRTKHLGGRNNRKPIKEDIPQWMKDEQSGKVKPKKADKLLNKLNQARIEHLQVIDDPKVSQDKKDSLAKREQHYQKLYDAQRKASFKSTPKLRENKQPLHKTSKALHNKVVMRLKRLGEC